MYFSLSKIIYVEFKLKKGGYEFFRGKVIARTATDYTVKWDSGEISLPYRKGTEWFYKEPAEQVDEPTPPAIIILGAVNSLLLFVLTIQLSLSCITSSTLSL